MPIIYSCFHFFIFSHIPFQSHLHICPTVIPLSYLAVAELIWIFPCIIRTTKESLDFLLYPSINKWSCGCPRYPPFELIVAILMLSRPQCISCGRNSGERELISMTSTFLFSSIFLRQGGTDGQKNSGDYTYRYQRKISIIAFQNHWLSGLCPSLRILHN
jgi:hypothetical protein